MAKRGRPTKLTKKFLNEIRKTLEEDLMLGMPIEYIADELGISRATFFNWLERGEKEQKGIYREFLDLVKKGQSLFVKRNLAVLAKAEKDKDTNWTPAAWLLERRVSDHFGKREQHEINGEGLKWVIEFADSESKGD
ncbi:hypothetical protein J7M07_04305 [bacterium]|nr:hypothetical protein [bacterium]